MMKLNKKVLTCALSVSMFAAAAPAMPVFAETAAVTGTEASAEKSEKPEKKDFLLELVEAGSLSQTTYDNIQTYIKEHAPERKDPANGENADSVGERPELPTNEDGSRPEKPANTDETRPEKPANTDETRPEKPAGTDETRPEKPANEDGTMGDRKGGRKFGMMNTDLLDKMLEAEVITQSEYDVISAAFVQMPQIPEQN